MARSTILRTPRPLGLTLVLALLTGLSCSDNPGEPSPKPPRGVTLLIANQTTGGGLDPDGYRVLVNQVDRGLLELNTTVQLYGLTPGQLSIELRDLASNCVAAEGATQTVAAEAGESAELRFNIHCTPPPELASLRLVFARGDGLYTMTADGSAVAQIATGEFYDLAVSPDGQWIAFTRGLDLYVIHPDGSGLRQITTYGWDPAWSPDGTGLVYAGPHGLLAIALTGGSAVRLTNPGSEYDHEPAWSPDGSRIAYSHSDGFDYSAVWLVNPDGNGAAPLPAALGDSRILFSWSPIWSPDGSRMVFVGLDGSSGLSVFGMLSNDLGVSKLYSLDASYGALTDWSPDGHWIAFTRIGNQSSDLYLLGADGSKVRVTADGVSQSAAFLRP